MAREVDRFESACNRFKQEIDTDFEEFATPDLLEIYFLLDHIIKGTLEDKRSNLALLIQERRTEE